VKIAESFRQLNEQVVACTRCPRLREHCLNVAAVKRRAYADQSYWGRPVEGFGDRRARIWIVGLAPGAHGANRTGRVFTGDRSGDFLYAALHRAGLANQPTSTHRDDGLALTGVYISAAARCAPPDNRPLPIELANCRSFLQREWELLTERKVIVALGRIGWDAALRLMSDQAGGFKEKRPEFAHGAEFAAAGVSLIGSYHVSQQNTFTGRLTDAMFDRVIERAKEIAGIRVRASSSSAPPCPPAPRRRTSAARG
jgi:uracil-DNA glycosylase family 4